MHWWIEVSSIQVVNQGISFVIQTGHFFLKSVGGVQCEWTDNCYIYVVFRIFSKIIYIPVLASVIIVASTNIVQCRREQKLLTRAQI